MFSLFPSTYSHPHTFPHSGYNIHSYANRDYLHALAQQGARERREAQYMAEARRRNAYQEQLARAEAARQRSNLFLGGFDDDSESYASFYSSPGPVHTQSRHDDRNISSSRGNSQTGDELLEDQILQKLAAGTEQSSHLERKSTPGPSHATEGTNPEADYENLQVSSTKTLPELREAAARTIQAFVGSHLPWLHAFRAIADISQRFENLKATFHFPSTLDFATSPPASDRDASEVPTLLYTPNNVPFHGHEHAIVKLLSELDAVESRGDVRIRSTRKELVKKIESELCALDAKKAEMWGEMIRKTSGEAPDSEAHGWPPKDSAEISSFIRSESADDMDSCIADEYAVAQMI